MPKPLHESVTLTERNTAQVTKSGRMSVVAISAGIGSSGYYSPKVLEQAAKDKLITKGTPVHIDHATEAERLDRPGRSVNDIAAVFTDDATYDAATESLVGEIKVFPRHRENLAELAPYIGLSISGSASDIVEGDVDGKRVPVVEGLAVIDAVDFVARAGRGGYVKSVLEAAPPEQVNRRAISHGVSEATVNDVREALQQALRDEYGGDKTYVWVRDFDDSTVWFEVEDGDGSGIFGQPYSESDGVVSLTGDRTEVRVVTKYVSVTRPDSTNPTTKESLEDKMAKIQIEESEHTRLTEKAGRVDALVSENATKDARIKELEEADAARTRADRAREIVGARALEAGVEFTPREVKGLLADITLTEAGEFDEAAFTTLVDEDAAAKKTAGTGNGLVGFGASAQGDPVEESAPTTTPWGRPVTAAKGA